MSESNSVSNVVIKCFKCGVISYLLFMMLSCLFSFSALKSDLLKLNMFLIAIAVLVFSSLFCGYISAGKLKIKGIFAGLISSIFFMVLVYITLAVASSFCFEYRAIIVLPICIIFSAIGAVIRKNIKTRR